MKKEEGEGGVNHRLDMLLGHKSKPSSWIGWRTRRPGGLGLAVSVARGPSLVASCVTGRRECSANLRVPVFGHLRRPQTWCITCWRSRAAFTQLSALHHIKMPPRSIKAFLATLTAHKSHVGGKKKKRNHRTSQDVEHDRKRWCWRLRSYCRRINKDPVRRGQQSGAAANPERIFIRSLTSKRAQWLFSTGYCA